MAYSACAAGLGKKIFGQEDVGDGVSESGVLPCLSPAPDYFGGSGLLYSAGSGRGGIAGVCGLQRQLCADSGGVPCGAADAGGEGAGWAKREAAY